MELLPFDGVVAMDCQEYLAPAEVDDYCSGLQVMMRVEGSDFSKMCFSACDYHGEDQRRSMGLD
uniref:Uncharacterized protein n=1 Tax=Leersia perrieri TaxID=77586 RepID=A0A0D9V3K2_9ORYZ